MDAQNNNETINNNIENNINTNISNDNLNILKNSLNENNLDILDKIDNFNIEEEEEQNDAYIQELIKQGQYSEVLKFLDSKDKKTKKNNNKNNDNNLNDYNSNINEDEELVLIPADDISDLHEDNIINNDNEENRNEIEKHLNLENEKIILNNENENENINENENNKNNIEKEVDIKEENHDKNKNDKDKNNNELNKENNKDNNNIIKDDNKNSLINNFVDNQNSDIINKDNNQININENENKNEINKQQDEKKNNELKSNEKEKKNDIPSSETIKQNNNINDNNNNNNKEEEELNKEENIKPKDLIKNIILNNNIESKNNKLRKSESSNSLNSSSILQLSYEEDEENNKYYEERLKDIQEQRKIFIEKTSAENDNKVVNNLELLTKELEELNELENNENEDLNGIEQMNEMYIMVQEDKQSSILQEKVREKLFPFYNKANFDINDIIKNDYFKSINGNRNFSISSKIMENKNVLKKKNNFNIDYPKSIFDNLKFDKSDIKNGLDYDEFLDEFLEEKNNNTKNNINTNINKNNEKIMKNNNSKVEKMFLKFKNKIKIKNNNNKKDNNKTNNIKPIKIFLNKEKECKNNNNIINDGNSNIKEKYEINLDEIYKKYKESEEAYEHNIDLKKYNNFFVDNFNKKNEIFNFNDYSIDLDLDDEIKKELTNNKNTQNNIEDKDKENYYLKINNNKTFNENLLNNYSLLRFINLENNNLTKFPDFSKCPMIYSINMNNNKINKIDKISSLKYLEKLSLTNNNISAIENCNNNKKLRFLFLGHNNISNIDNIASEVPFIEEMILCQNNITYLPNKIYLPYLKFFDLNENKISFNTRERNLLYFICPSLEKLLLLGNNLNEEGTQFLIKYCPKLKEIDLSFNKYNNIIELIKILSINSSWNNNLEMINVVGNTFFNSNKNKELFYLLVKRFCPSIKYINNEEIKKNKNQIIINYNNIPVNNYSLLNCNLNESFINIYNSQNSFMKYFTSVYFTNKIFNIYNININNNLKTSNVELFLLINQAYFQFKLSHFISQVNINKSNIGFFSFDSKFQFDILLTYLYKFKNRMTYITHSIPILVKRTWFRRMKIIKIQQQYKLRILRKKLAAIVIPDDEYDHAEDLLDFFNSDSKKENKINEDEKMIDIDLGLDKKMKEIEKNIENNMKNKKSKSKSNFHFLEVIKEEDKDIDTLLGINQINHNSNNNIIDNKNNKDSNNKTKEKIEITENKNKTNHEKIDIDVSVNKKAENNNKLININNKIDVPTSNENHKEKDDLVMKLLSNAKYNPNNRLNPIRLTPITKNSNNIQSIQSSTNIISNNNNINNINSNNPNNYNNHQNIDILKMGLAPKVNSNRNINFVNDNISNAKAKHPQKIFLKDDKNYGILYDINAKSNLPKNPPHVPGLVSGKKRDKYSSIRRPESNGVFLPSINNNKLNESRTTISNETKSVYSNMTNGKKYIKVGKPKEVILLEQECREAIEKAKIEWGFTNKEVEKILVNKIQKNYKKKIDKILNKFG